MPATPIDTYRRQIQRELQAGNATEHTHRPALKTLIESLVPGITATNEPKRVECGAPDYVISRKSPHGPVSLGYVEAKDVGKPLDEIERSDQMKRYLPALPNLILTDYLEFRWYVSGEHRQTARLARDSKGGKLTPEKDGAGTVTGLLTEFLSREAEQITDPKTLALRMARLTHFIRDMIIAAFDSKSASGTLTDLHSAFEKALIPDLPIPQFADMFAQTLAYGLFAARCNHHGPKGSFKRLGAASEIPKTNPFLRQLFETITGNALDDEPYAGFVDDLAQLLADTDIDEVLADFGKRTARQDPVVHFYETFLAAYDPKLRERRGVYYTPEPVVSYVVRSVDYLLKTRFGCANGLADTATVEYEREEESAGKVKKVKATSPRVLILDPACGTGTFLYTVVDHIREEFMRQGNAGMWSGYVRNHLLPRIFGFELLMAPYAVAHFKLGMQLAGHDLTPAQREKWAYDFTGNERLGVYLTNTLEEAEQKAETLFGPLRVITQEANAASRIKARLPILAVIGNPPYSGISANSGKWIEGLMEDYKTTVREQERQIQRLSNDYVKFIRFAQWRLEQTGHGILAFITDSGYLEGILFRDMRQALLDVYSDIFILNLHGVAVRGPQNAQVDDQNVFDITQGVAIAIFLKEAGKTGRARLHYADLIGSREHKYQVLSERSVADTPWQELSARPPSWYFVPTGSDSDYESWPLFTQIIGTGSPKKDRDSRYGTGVKTRHDEFVIGWSPGDALRRVKQIADRSESDEQLIQELKLCTTAHFDIRSARARARDANLLQCVRPIAYRPFDQRHLVYLREFICEPKLETMRHLLHSDNMAIGVLRRDRKELGAGFFAATGLIAKDMVSNLDDALIWPLYVYPNTSPKAQEQSELGISDPLGTGKDGRRPNLNPEFTTGLGKRLGLVFVYDGRGNLETTFGPEDFFNYIYAVFHSPTYRTRYAEFLKSDFPRVPLTSDMNLFRSLCELGGELVALHLLESPMLQNPVARYPLNGPDLVEKGFPKYVAPGEPEPGTRKPLEQGRVYISKDDPGNEAKAQYFEGVPPEVWQFHIGGYQVCEKWLKDRRGRTLTYDDQMHYCKVATAIKETIRLMAEIDAAIPEWPIE